MPHTHPIPSLAAVRGHPIHPMLIPFPIAFLVGAFAADIAFWATGTPFWAEASFWLTAAGLATGVLAGLVGLTDFAGRREIRNLPTAWGHLFGNSVALAVAVVSLGLRLEDAAAAVLPWGIVLSGTITAILLVTGWLGGEMAYRHRVGGIETPGEAEGEAVIVVEAEGPPPPAANLPGESAPHRRRSGQA